MRLGEFAEDRVRMLGDRVTAALDSFSGPAGRDNAARCDVWLEDRPRALPPGSSILDAGAGTQLCRRFCGRLEYVYQDFCGYDGRGDGTALQSGTWPCGTITIVSDIAAIPRLDASFDVVMAIEVLEHLPDPLAALRELQRLLKPGGHLILTAPFSSWTHQSPFHFATGFIRYWYTRHLPALGLRIEELVANGNYFEFMSQEIRRFESVAGQYASSRMSWPERVAAAVVLRGLSRMGRQDEGSAELLRYGCQVHAVKT